jgi:ABC-type multidrug transport system fused ATPase/permease subunit
LVINRKPGSPQEIIYKALDDTDDTSSRSRKSSAGDADVEAPAEAAEREIKAILPRYDIDSMSETGLRPDIVGAIQIQRAHFSYPTRPEDPVLQGLSIDVEPGQTVALVGPSGGGMFFIFVLWLHHRIRSSHGLLFLR